ncbi:MAG: tripartite tricarboxylate transporter TctB family protein [Pseudomonadota bacterium]|nr:tripartite tricarboxylate transporter TctB family protein [Pseudomonadota bacterium]
MKQRRRAGTAVDAGVDRSLAGGLGATVLSLIILGAALFSGSGEAFFFPRLLAVIMTGLSIVVLWDGIRSLRSSDAREGVRWRDIGAGSTVILGYLIVLEVLGFYASSFIAFALIAFCYLPLRNRRSFLTLASVSVVFTGIVYLSFQHMLQVMTPRGILF